MLKPELEAWQQSVLVAAERWCRTLDADVRHEGDVGRARDALRRAIGYPCGCFSTCLPPADDEAPGDDGTERLVVIGYEVPTLNRVKYMHWSRRKRDKAMLRMQLASQLVTESGHRHRHGKRMPKPVPRRCHFRILRRRVNGLDEDNVIGGMKDFVDCVEAVGLIWEDSPLWFRPSYQLVKAGPDGPGIELELWDVPQTTWTDAQARAVERATAKAEDPAWVRKERTQALAAKTMRGRR